MKELLEKLIRRRNPAFQFDPEISTYMLFQFALTQALQLVRGLKVMLLLKRPKWAMMGSGVRLIFSQNIRWGRFLKLGKHVRISGLGRQGVQIGNNVGIGAFSSVVVSASLNDLGNYIRIGNNVGIGEYAYLGGAGGLEIGDDCIAGQYLSCHPENHEFGHLDQPIRRQGVTRKGIRIGSNCWLGSKVTILDGVTIGDGSVVAAGAVVTSSFPENSIIGGVPAKLLKTRRN